MAAKGNSLKGLFYPTHSCKNVAELKEGDWVKVARADKIMPLLRTGTLYQHHLIVLPSDPEKGKGELWCLEFTMNPQEQKRKVRLMAKFMVKCKDYVSRTTTWRRGRVLGGWSANRGVQVTARHNKDL